ncbi:hypothetical protein E2320_014493, partial [Naja naja]
VLFLDAGAIHRGDFSSAPGQRRWIQLCSGPVFQEDPVWATLPADVSVNENDKQARLNLLQMEKNKVKVSLGHQRSTKRVERKQSEDAGEKLSTSLPVVIRGFLSQQDQEEKRKGKYRKKENMNLKITSAFPRRLGHTARETPGDDGLENENSKQARLKTEKGEVEEVIFGHEEDTRRQERNHSENGEEKSSTSVPVGICSFLSQQDLEGKKKEKYGKKRKVNLIYMNLASSSVEVPSKPRPVSSPPGNREIRGRRGGEQFQLSWASFVYPRAENPMETQKPPGTGAADDGPENENDKPAKLNLQQLEKNELEVMFGTQGDITRQERSRSEEGAERTSTFLSIGMHGFLSQQDEKGKRRGKYEKKEKNDFDLCEYGRNQTKEKTYGSSRYQKYVKNFFTLTLPKKVYGQHKQHTFVKSGRGFSLTSEVKLHVEYGKGFSSKNYLNLHQSIHTGRNHISAWSV